MVGEASGEVFYGAIQVCFLVAAGIAMMGVFTSASRGEDSAKST
jgi:hypothetical protein